MPAKQSKVIIILKSVGVVFVVSLLFVGLFYGSWHYRLVPLPPSLARSFGLIEASVYRSVFLSRVEPTVKLPATFHRQEHSLSCEAAALKTAFSAYGLDILESEIIEHLPFDPTPRRSGIWGDPHQGFVGNIDGAMMVNGYGVYWEPIAQVGLNWRRTELISQGTISVLVEHLEAGRPIVIWGYVGRGNGASWRTSSDKEISAINGEHARVLVGFSGNRISPDGFYVIDPIYGELFWSYDKFLEQWDSFDRAGVVVYEHPRWVSKLDSFTLWEISKDGQSRHPLYFHWEDFEAIGGSLDNIQAISQVDLEKFEIGDPIYPQ